MKRGRIHPVGHADTFVNPSREPTIRDLIEADEYDTSFFDKRAKFVHYH